MSTSNKGDSLINVTELGDYIKRKRESEKLSLRMAAKQSRVGAATLYRIENDGGVPDTQTLARLGEWLNIPLDRVITRASSQDTPIIYYPHESTPDIVFAHLRADPNLTPEIAKDLADLFRIAYNLRLPKRP